MHIIHNDRAYTQHSSAGGRHTGTLLTAHVVSIKTTCLDRRREG